MKFGRPTHTYTCETWTLKQDDQTADLEKNSYHSHFRSVGSGRLQIFELYELYDWGKFRNFGELYNTMELYGTLRFHSRKIFYMLKLYK